MAEKEVKETAAPTPTVEELTAENEQVKKAYAELAEAFNKLLKEYNDLHVTLLFKK